MSVAFTVSEVTYVRYSLLEVAVKHTQYLQYVSLLFSLRHICLNRGRYDGYDYRV